MTAVLLLVVLACVALPSAYAVALFPTFWLLERLVVAPGETVVTIGPVDATVTDVALVVLFGRFLITAVSKRRLDTDRGLYAMLALFSGGQSGLDAGGGRKVWPGLARSPAPRRGPAWSPL